MFVNDIYILKLAHILSYLSYLKILYTHTPHKTLAANRVNVPAEATVINTYSFKMHIVYAVFGSIQNSALKSSWRTSIRRLQRNSSGQHDFISIDLFDTIGADGHRFSK